MPENVIVSNKPTEFQKWKSTIEDLRTNRRLVERKWLRSINFYRGHQWDKTSPMGERTDEITVNITFANTRILESLLIYKLPYLRIRPLKPEDAPAMTILQDVTNYYLYKVKSARTFRKNVVDTSLIGHGWAGVIHSRYHLDGILEDTDSVMMIYTSPLDMYTELDIGSLYEASFYIRRMFPSTRRLQKIFPKYTWTADAEQELVEMQRRRGILYKTSTRSIIYEILDLLENKIIYLAPQHSKVLTKIDYPYHYLKNGYWEPLMFAEDPDDIYPISETEIVESQQVELNKIRTQQMSHRKRFNRRYLLLKDSMTDDEIDKIEQGEDGTIAITENLNCLQPVPDAMMTPDIQIYQQDIKSDVREIIGINEYLRSGMIPRTKSASESGMIAAGSSIRTKNKAYYMEEFVLGLSSKLARIIQNEFDDIDFYRVVGEQGIQQLNAWTKEDVQGDFEVEMQMGEMLPPEPVPFERGDMQAQLAPGQAMPMTQPSPAVGPQG